MKYGIKYSEMVKVSNIFLDHNNPRHEQKNSDAEVIDTLCKEEQIFQLAKDICAHQLNPLELFALVPIGKKKRTKNSKYTVAEGNRRLCALKLLNDPELAPPKERSKFTKLAENWKPIPEIFAVVFDKPESVKIWLDRTHGNQQDGIGRRKWTSIQITRAAGGVSENAPALQLLDYSSEKGYISESDRKGRLSTVTRFLKNVHLKEALGIEIDSGGNISRFRDDADFKILLKKFMSDVASKEITTRKQGSKDEIKAYSRQLQAEAGLSGKITEPEELEEDNKPKIKTKKASRHKKAKARTRLGYSDALGEALKDIPSYKLEHLYSSLTSIELSGHTPLLTVGLWSLIETLTAIAGRDSKTDFWSFLSANKLENLGLGKKNKTKGIRLALKHISDIGNTTKHDVSAANFNGEQLANHLDTIQICLEKLARNTAR